MSKYFYFFLIVLFYCPTVFAMFCPSNLNFINLGDSIEDVEKVCKPDARKIRKVEPVDTTPQEWTYYVKQDPKNTTSMSLVVFFDKEHKVMNISVNGAGVSMTKLCGSVITSGDSMETVKAACHEPTFIKKGQPAENPSAESEKATEIIEFKYNTTPSVTLTFEQGKLTSRSSP